MNKNLIKILAYIGATTFLMGCVQIPAETKAESTKETSTVSVEESSNELSGYDKAMAQLEEQRYVAVVTFNGNIATIYDDFDHYEHGYKNSAIYIYYNISHEVSENVFVEVSDELKFTDYFFYNGYDMTKEEFYAFVNSKIEGNGEVVYYTDQANILSRGN